MTKDIHSPHDRFFTSTFKNKETAARFLEAYLPQQALELMDVNQLEVDNTHFVDEALQQYRSDLLYQIPLKNGQPTYIYILFE
ncbi:MAG: Rpn family recombination-promoting nuclease/putative transposase, partial [Pseudomonadota bacterium]